MTEPCQVIIKGMVDYLRTHDAKYGLDDIHDRLPKYYKIIMDNIVLADKACIEESVEKTKEYARSAMGYYKKAISILKGDIKK